MTNMVANAEIIGLRCGSISQNSLTFFHRKILGTWETGIPKNSGLHRVMQNFDCGDRTVKIHKLQQHNRCFTDNWFIHEYSEHIHNKKCHFEDIRVNRPSPPLEIWLKLPNEKSNTNVRVYIT